MLTCKDVTLRASDLVDGETSLWLTFRMRLHLAMCVGCRRFVHQISVTRDLTEPPMPNDPRATDIDAIFARLDAKRDGDVHTAPVKNEPITRL
ncbi:MAG: zf-HC2 domain-containing protein [Deltaproteobacteria bacterium]